MYKSCILFKPSLVCGTKSVFARAPHPRIAATIFRHLSSVSEEAKEPQEIYSGILSKQIRHVKIFSLSTSAMGLAFQPILYEKFVEPDASIGPLVALSTTVGLFTFVTPFLIHYITKKYVTRMVYDPQTETFTAETYNFFLRRQDVTFKAEDVEVPDVPGMFTSFLAKGKPLFCDPSCFTSVEYYAKLMGYDKPIDFELGSEETKARESDTEAKKQNL